MTPTETAAILRQLNAWRRCDKNIRLPDSRDIGEAIDAAIAMIDRLEAAEQMAQDYLRIDGEKARIAQRLEAAEKERDAMRAKVEAMEKRLRLILEEPENTMSNSKALREMVRQARLALEESK